MKIKSMLFGKVRCSKCNKEYDECLPCCPYCDEKNNNVPERIIKSHISWFSFPIQITYFLVGFVGFFLLSALVSLLSYSLKDNEAFYLLITNTTTYSVIFIAMLLICLFSKTKILYHFKDYKGYIVGVIGFVILVGLSFGITAIFESFMKVSPGQNQRAVEILVKNYPVVAFLILGIIGPIVEEFTYRIGLFSFISRINRVLAYIVTIVFFTLIHLNFTSKDIINELISIPDYVLGASMLAITYDLRGPAASITAHILNNLFSIIYILVGK